MGLRRIALGTLALAVLGSLTTLLLASAFVSMPGKSFRGAWSGPSAAETALAAQLRRDVEVLARDIGERNVGRHTALDRARAFIAGELSRAGYAVEEQSWTESGVECANVIVERRGSTRAEQIVLVGAHYDTVPGCPGANDNGSGVAALLAIARALAKAAPEHTLRFVAFANEEPPYFATEAMGSARHAARCAERDEDVVVMISLETIGYYTDEEGSQQFPAPGLAMVYPTRGDFISLVGNFASRERVREAVRVFRETTEFPCEGAALPGAVPGVGWSDQLFFWKHGYSALMATDTAPFRYAHYHEPSDTPEKLDYERMARVVGGLQRVIEHWAGVPAARQR